MPRLDIEKQNKLEPKRIDTAKREIGYLGYDIIYEDKTKIQFKYKGEVITYFAFSGWSSGKGIKDGRGLINLINQIRS